MKKSILMIQVLVLFLWCVTAATAGSISGSVTDTEDQPLEGINVFVLSKMCGDGSDILASMETDDSGYYQIDGLPVMDVHVIACATCSNRNFLDFWYDGGGGVEACNLSVPVSVVDGAVIPGIDFNLEKGPKRERWTEVSVYDGVLGAGFDLQPGFEDLIVSATLSDPNGGQYEFDLQTDTFQWLNDCYYNKIMWWLDLTEGDDILYEEYRLTLRFRDGYAKTYVHNLQNISIEPVDQSTMSYLVNADGSIDFSFANPDPGNTAQWHRVMIYKDGSRYLSFYVPIDQSASVYSVHVTPYQLRCLEIGGQYEWHIRAHDNNDPYNVTLKTAFLPLIYNPSNLGDQTTSFSATHSKGELWLYFNTRPGSRENITSASVSGPENFQYTFDLNDDWFDLSTEARIINGWFKSFLPPFDFGDYTLDITFDDGPPETRTVNLPYVDVVPVDAATIQVDILENGAMNVAWALPTGGTGQRYQVRIRSTDGLQEFYSSNPESDLTSLFISPWDLRGLAQGAAYELFIRSYDPDLTTMAQSESKVMQYDPFELFSKADIDKDWDVDGWDLAAIVQLILDGEIDDLPEAMAVITFYFGDIY